MWISRLSLRDYRSYPELDLEFSPGVTTFVADNGTGKTNIVEAIGYLAHQRSHRVAFDAPLVHEGVRLRRCPHWSTGISGMPPSR